MTIEEKAKAYDEAKARMSKAFNDNRCTIGFMNEIFPELKDSEDERIRKELLEHCKNQAKPYIQTGNKCPQIQSWIAWLEKQGNPKSTNIDIAAMVKAYKERLTNGADCINGPLIDTYLTAFRRGVENTLDELNLENFINKSKEND